jgi:peptidoglycan hydrolase-like protein with peptidoglycan-binding domain
MRKIFVKMLCAAMVLCLCTSGFAEQNVGSERVLEIERALYSLGYHSDNFDALLDDVTKAALRSFQRANDLNPTGEPDSATLMYFKREI